MGVGFSLIGSDTCHKLLKQVYGQSYSLSNMLQLAQAVHYGRIQGGKRRQKRTRQNTEAQQWLWIHSETA